jgi:hypothetical protein
MREDYNDENMTSDVCYVRTGGWESRVLLIEFLEKNGYVCEEDTYSVDVILETRFPVKVDIEHKKYGCLQTRTCAAAAVSSGNMFTIPKFYSFLEFVSPYIIV